MSEDLVTVAKYIYIKVSGSFIDYMLRNKTKWTFSSTVVTVVFWRKLRSRADTDGVT